MNDQHPSAQPPPRPGESVIVVGAGPVGCTAALLLADFGIPVTLLERYAQPHPLPRAVHLDDEVARILDRVGVSEGFHTRSRSCGGLRLLDAEHRVMAEFRREHQASKHGFPQANMFHQPDLEELLLSRVERHPLIRLRRGAEVCGLDDPAGPLTAASAQVRARLAGDQTAQTLTGRFVLGCDGANSTIRDLAGITMKDLGFTERWLVVDLRAETGLDTWDGVEQVCDPARAATFMQVTGDRYRWEFQLHHDEDEAALITPQALGRLLQPWTGRSELDGLEIIRTASYTFRARLAARFQSARVFLLGDVAHLTPPFIGQGLAAGLRDADNLAWKIAHVLTGQAGAELLTTYDTERRPHAKAMIRKAVLVGWAMTGGQDQAATIRRIALAAAVRSERIRRAIASTATPRLKIGALQQAPRHFRRRPPAALRTGSLIPNPLVITGHGPPVRLDTVLRDAPPYSPRGSPAPNSPATAASTACSWSVSVARLERAETRHDPAHPQATAGSIFTSSATGSLWCCGPSRATRRSPSWSGQTGWWQPSAPGPGCPTCPGASGRFFPRAQLDNPQSLERHQSRVPTAERRLTMFIVLSLLLAATCLLPGSAKLLAHPKMRKAATHLGFPWRGYQLIGLAELAAAAGVLIGLWWHPLGVAAAAGMALLLAGALLAHRQARDAAKEIVPALLALAITIAYLAVAITG